MNYTMIAPPLNQAQIVARLAGATIAPLVINATGKISTSSTAADSIETAGGGKFGGILRVLGSGFSEFRRPENDETARVHMQFSRGNGTGIIGDIVSVGNSANGVAQLGIRLNNSNIVNLLSTGAQILGTLPAPSTAGQTNIGGGRIDTFERIISRSTAAEAIESLGGITAAAAVNAPGMRSATVTVAAGGVNTITLPLGYAIVVMGSSGLAGDANIFSAKAIGGSQGTTRLTSAVPANWEFGSTSEPTSGTRGAVWVSGTNTLSFRNSTGGPLTFQFSFLAT